VVDRAVAAGSEHDAHIASISTRGGWLDGWPRDLRLAMRRVLVLSALLPLVVLLAREVPRLPQAPLVLSYGVIVLGATICLLYLGYAHYDDPSVHAASGQSKKVLAFPRLPDLPTVSLLVAVKDEKDGIEACVRSMTGCDHPRLQVIVVDDASTDGTVERLRRLEAELGITVLYLEANLGKKKALTAGAELARGDILAFTDSDCVLASDALSRCVQALVGHPDLGAVSGHARALNADATILTRGQDTWYEGQFRVLKAAESVFGSVTCVSGPLAVFRREAIYNYLPAWAEDTFLGQEFRFATDRQLTGYVLGQKWIGRHLKQSHAESPFVTEVDYAERRWRVGYVRSARVLTTVPESFRAFMRQQVRWKKSFVRNIFFTGSFMWRRGLGPSLIYYGHVLWSVGAPFMVVRHLIWAPAHGSWLLTVLYLCGVLVKGTAWGLAYKVDHRHSTRWRYRPLMSLFSAVALSWLLPYSIATIRRNKWSRAT
jgi:cellulose synthase/poly-beta-1,6-N-acetylglucosamine synthase-like glycosyltransferase